MITVSFGLWRMILMVKYPAQKKLVNSTILRDIYDSGIMILPSKFQTTSYRIQRYLFDLNRIILPNLNKMFNLMQK